MDIGIEITMIDRQEVVVHGGGYVGLIGGIHMALAGVNVVFYDPDPNVIEAINNGNPKSNEYLGYIDDDFKNLVNNKKIRGTIDFDSIKHKYVHFIAVPTERKDKPYMNIVKDCIFTLHDSVPKSSLIIVESTLQPGTINSIYLPRVYANEIYLAVCPRTDWIADSQKNVTNLPRIIGGVTPESTTEAVNLLSKVCKDIYTTNHKVAEFAKAGQNHLYFVQIMAAHEMAEEFQGNVDFNEALKFIGLHWRLPELYLGPGVSGRCIQMGTQYMVEASKNTPLRIAKDALNMDRHWREIIGDRLTKEIRSIGIDSEILILGIAYRPDFSDFGYSAGLDIARYLVDNSWDVSIHDPIVKYETLLKTGIKVDRLSDKYDCVLLATGHRAYADLPMVSNIWKRNSFVLDACGLWERHRKLFDIYKVKYVRVGEENWMER